MPSTASVAFAPLSRPAGGALAVFVDDALALSSETQAILGSELVATIARASAIESFKGKARSGMTLLAPAGSPFDKVAVIGVGKPGEIKPADWAMLGGAVAGRLGAGAATLVADLPGRAVSAEEAAEIGLGAILRGYRFDRYKSKADEDAPPEGLTLTIGAADPAAAKKAFKARAAVAEGVNLARDLVNEPPNVLHPEEFARRAEGLAKLGVEVEVLERKKLEKLGMRALLGVSQGSVREPRVVIMRWNGLKTKKSAKGEAQAPIAVVGKGVCFDTGGVSIKPAQGMEDMKGDMAGAACVVGLMHALAARKAKVDVVGAIGLVENMPDGAAQRPGDIVVSMSGQTIEIINTDAEGRLVLADVLWHIRESDKPRAIVDLATLTGAILVALAHEHAGLFANDETLAAELTAAGEATGETVWRMPLGPAFDKMIDSKVADMKNAAGRNGGSTTAAQFLKRFVGDTPWAHLDIAGVGMGSKDTEINRSWGAGWGVRLLDRWIGG